MTKAISPSAMPSLPDGAVAWGRKLRQGSMFHAHALGHPICWSAVYLERFKQEAPRDLGDMQYWGVCPRCYAKSRALDTPAV